MDLGRPLAGVTVPTDGFDQGEHGTGTGLSGGHGVPNKHNTQSGMAAAEEKSGFNAGLGGEHASGGLPHGSSKTPIADQYTSASGGTLETYKEGGSGNQQAAQDFSNSSSRREADQATSGAYSGSGTSDALTGQSSATSTGPGVGYQGENLSGEHHHHHHHHHSSGQEGGAVHNSGGLTHTSDRGAGYGDEGVSQSGRLAGGALAGTAAGMTAGAALGSGETHTGTGKYESTGTGVGPSGGSGGHYSTQGGSTGYDDNDEVVPGAKGTGAGAGAMESVRGSGETGHHGTGEAGQTGGAGGLSGITGGKTQHSESDTTRGQPISNPEDIDTGGPHSLVFDKATGKYEHRRDM